MLNHIFGIEPLNKNGSLLEVPYWAFSRSGNSREVRHPEDSHGQGRLGPFMSVKCVTESSQATCRRRRELSNQAMELRSTDVQPGPPKGRSSNLLTLY